MGSAEKGEQYYRSGRVLWVVKSGNKLYGKVLGSYPYLVMINLKSGKSMCTCPLGGNCKHVHAVMKAYNSGFYFENSSSLSEVNAEAVAWSLLLEMPELALEVSLKELTNSLGRDESGSETAVHF
ncbi:SWIM zinc finger family protein, partial [Thermococcus sp.]